MCESGNCETCEAKSDCCDWGNHTGKTTVCRVCHRLKCTECSELYYVSNESDDMYYVCGECI